MVDEVTVNIDAGGTFTDGFFTYRGDTVSAKVPTTEHDLTVCFIECIEQGADQLGTTLPDLLRAADVVRFSTTLGTNTVIEKTGPRLGVIVTAGNEETLYADAGDPTIVDGFVDEEMVCEIQERTSPTGELITEPNEREVKEAVKDLQENGARLVVIALENSFANRDNEVRVKRLVEDEYPRHYLGAIASLASYEVSSRPDDYGRLNTVVVNAYIHRAMKSSLYKAEDKVRNHGYARPLFIGHSSGGVARVAKTVALNTHNSGPAAGVIGVTVLSWLYGDDVVATDMGGTSIDISQAVGGEYDLHLTPAVDGLPTHIPAIGIRSAGAGGGSIATVEDGQLSVGPESAGVNPGPACFGRGGQRATVTDADVVLERINPEYFLGGRFSLDPERARETIKTSVADPLGLSVEESARRIVNRIEEKIATATKAVSDGRVGLLTSYGGAGPVHAAGYAKALDADRVLIPPTSSVFSAFGESLMNVHHSYSYPVRTITDDRIEKGIAEMQAEAERDMRAEGFETDEIDFDVDILVHANGDTAKRSLSEIDSTGSIASETVANLGGERYTLRLHVTGDIPTPEFERRERTADIPDAAHKGTREVYWTDGYEPTTIYQLEELLPGNTVGGPAIVEAVDTTITVPEDMSFGIDEYGHGVLQ